MTTVERHPADHEHAGEISRYVTTMAEPEWDDESRDLAVAFHTLDMCGYCGQPTAVCHDPALQFDWRAGDPTRCHAHTARLAKQKGVTEETHPGAGALSWPVELRERTR